MIEVIKLVGIGIVLGVSNVIPGVSGGTMAVVFGIYDKLISVITIDVKKILSMWKFWLPLAIGVGIGIIGSATILVSLFSNYPIPTSWFFIGLIAGSLPLIVGKIKESCGNIQSPPISVVTSMLIALAIMIVMDTLNNESFSNIVQTELTMPLFFFLLASGAIAAIAMIIPGISGSFLLLVIGSYTTIITATSISQLNIPILIPVAIGVPLGLLGGAKLIRVLLEKAPAQTYGAILGLVTGSIVVIYPGIQLSLELLISVLTLVVGFSLAYFSSRK